MQNRKKQTNMGLDINNTDAVIGAIFTNVLAFVELYLIARSNAFTEPHLTQECVVHTPHRLKGIRIQSSFLLHHLHEILLIKKHSIHYIHFKIANPYSHVSS